MTGINDIDNMIHTFIYTLSISLTRVRDRPLDFTVSNVDKFEAPLTLYLSTTKFRHVRRFALCMLAYFTAAPNHQTDFNE